MRLQILHVFVALCTLLVLAHAWTKEDHEIFRLRDEVADSEGVEVSFYDFVGVKPGASVDDINKAFRKKSKALHPDKVKHNFIASKSVPKPKQAGEKKKPGVHVSKGPSQNEINKFAKQATERYQRLGVVAGVLKGTQRERYDHFLNHGFPTWRGTGYYYTRYRPGLGTVLIGLFIVGGGAAHYGVLILTYNRQREFMDKYIRSARKQAWGDESGIQGIPGVSGPVQTPAAATPEESDPTANLNRRQKREFERQSKKPEKKSKNAPKTAAAGRVLGTGEEADYGSSTSPVGARRRVTAANGKPLIVDSVGNVFLEEEDEEGNKHEFLLDVDEIARPTLRDTALVKFPIYLYRKAFDPFLKNTGPAVDPFVPEDEKMQLPSDETVAALNIPSTTTTSSSTSVVQDLSSSTEGFEVVDSTGIEKEMTANATASKKKNKKGKK